MTYTKKIANFEGYEFSQEFDCSETGAKEPIILSGNNNGGIMGVVTYEYTPAVKEKLVEVYEMPSAMDPATYGTTTFVITSSASDVGNAEITIPLEGSYNCGISSGDTAEQIAAKIRAIDMSSSDFSLSGSGAEVIVTRSAYTGNNIQTYLGANLEASGEPAIFSFTGPTVVDGLYEGGAKRAIYADIPGGIESNSAGDITVYFGSLTGTTVTIAENETVQTLATKIAAQKPTADWSVSTPDMGGGTYILQIRYNIPQALDEEISIDYGTTGLNESAQAIYIPGVDATGGEGALVPGNIEIFFNSDEAVEVAVEEGDELSDVYAKIAALEVDGYTITSDSNISIECDVGGAHAISLSVDLGETGITKTSSTLTEGADEFSNDAESVVIKTERTIDTRERVVADTAQWVVVDDDISANTYTEEAFSSPWTAIRVNCKTEESGAVARLIIRTAE